MSKELNLFTIKEETGIWVAFLDGKPIKCHNKLACETRGAISTSFSQKLNYYRSFKRYGFNSSKEMKTRLENSGRLIFKNLLDV